MTGDILKSHTGCKIPEEVFTMLISLNVRKFTKPVWNLYRTFKSGFAVPIGPSTVNIV